MDTITPSEVKERLSKGEKLNLLDVREDEEIAQGAIPGVQHIPLGELPERYREIPQADEIIVICRSGNRSGKACEYLASVGVTGLKNMVGGMLEWEKL
ncbi:Probable adenylyltransferase/sulfurtransferase MoeZ [Chlamydia abortus]|uniref:Rhodanese-like domain-containing protein n=1 Tax=Paenibacillus residui TaxID=629724 RepID=A0ABW3DB41_9BACL|nr:MULTISPECIES: rhodanese-like domain-containing protein [Paenibacillaceae]SHE11548.1 Probable adenylyltransferase/sulfurtransferase MoeZ [Chlamydia abortus]